MPRVAAVRSIASTTLALFVASCGGTSAIDSAGRPDTQAAAGGTRGSGGAQGSSGATGSDAGNAVRAHYCTLEAPAPVAKFEFSETSSFTANLTNPPGTNDQAAVWTGEELLLWGGDKLGTTACPPGTIGSPKNEGGRYQPILQEWHQMSVVNAPAPRQRPLAVWTGSELVVWGGFNDPIDVLRDGGRYDPALDRWLPMSSVGAPVDSCSATVAWTSREVLVWRGEKGGALYDPATDRWRPMSSSSTLKGSYGVGAWSGRELIAVNGITWVDRPFTARAAAYDPERDSWRTLPDPPIEIRDLQALWTGARLLLWGRSGGALFDPCADTWSVLSGAAAPFDYLASHALWVNDQMLVWGSALDGPFHAFTYDPWNDAWTDVTPARSFPTVVWTGETALIPRY